VGAYEIVGLLGSGGMGEVHRARDTRLGRDVALKALPRSLVQDSDRRARFDREARLLAALNHPGIGAIHGIEDTPDGPLLVLELVPGDTLDDQLLAGPLPLAEALTVCLQIADAVAFAHGQGIVHRDLKPANVKYVQNGRAKVLDFGLAKTVEDHTRPGRNEPTITQGDTRERPILGTPAYMSPEQARGREVDRRTDVWSLGCILYELLTGRRLFQKATTTETLAAVLTQEPDWSALPSSTPPAIRTLLRRCLQRDPDRPLHDMADVRLELEDALATTTGDASDGKPSPPPGRGGVGGLELTAMGVIALEVVANMIFLSRFVPPLAGFRYEIAESLSRPLRVYLGFADRGRWAAVALALLWIATYARRPRFERARRQVLIAVAGVGVLVSFVGLWLVAEEGVLYGMKLNIGLKGTVVTKDLATLYLAARRSDLAIKLLDPEHRRDYPSSDLGTWGAAGRAFQLAEAYRAAGDLEAAGRLYARAQEGATSFDETLSQAVVAQEERWQREAGLDLGEWALSIAQIRQLPDLVRSVSEQRLQEIARPDATRTR
jgi:serine/threonine protein kinase